MIDKYIEHGEIFVLDDYGIKAESVITKETDCIYEIKYYGITWLSTKRLWEKVH